MNANAWTPSILLISACTSGFSLIEERVRSRETTPEQELGAARWWVSRLEGATLADHLVDNSDRPPRDVAAEVLRALGWLE